MSDEPTPWEDINPPMASARRQELASRCSAPEPREVFRNELTACLALVAPVGMTEEAKRDWLLVAWEALRHLPPNVLQIGCKAARQKCDHPSKIVPTVIAETRDLAPSRRSAMPAEPLAIEGPPPEYCSPEDAKRILSEYGLKRAWQ